MAFEETGRVVGSFAAGTLVGLAMAGGEIFSLGKIMPLAIGALVTATAAGVTTRKKFGHYLYPFCTIRPKTCCPLQRAA